MSRIGKLPIAIPQGVRVAVKGQTVTVEGPKGKLERELHPAVRVEVSDGQVRVLRVDDSRQSRALHGLSRTLVANMVEGVTKGFEKVLQIVGVGYRAAMKGKALALQLGYSHEVLYEVPAGVEVVLDNPTLIRVRGSDKELVGRVAAEIRAFKKPEPYKGKGIRYVGEQVRRKAGKSGA